MKCETCFGRGISLNSRGDLREDCSECRGRGTMPPRNLKEAMMHLYGFITDHQMWPKVSHASVHDSIGGPVMSVHLKNMADLKSLFPGSTCEVITDDRQVRHTVTYDDIRFEASQYHAHQRREVESFVL